MLFHITYYVSYFFLCCDHIPDKKKPKGRRNFWLLVLRVRMHHGGNTWWQKVQAACHTTFTKKKNVGVRAWVKEFQANS